MAAPHVAGAWAVLQSAFGAATKNEITRALNLSGTDTLAQEYGSGAITINVHNALKILNGESSDFGAPELEKFAYKDGLMHIFFDEKVNLLINDVTNDGQLSAGKLLCQQNDALKYQCQITGSTIFSAHYVSDVAIALESGNNEFIYSYSSYNLPYYDKSGNRLQSKDITLTVDSSSIDYLNEIVEIQTQLSQSTAEANSEVTVSGVVNYFNGEPVESIDSLIIRRADGTEWKVSSDYIDGNEFSYRIIAPEASSNITIEATSSPYSFEASESLYITISADGSDNGANNDSGSNGDESGNDDYLDYDYYYPNDTEVTVSGSYGDGDDYFVYFKIGRTTSYKRLINGTFNLTKSRPTDNAEYAILEIRDSDKETVLASSTFLVREKYVSPDEDFDNSLSFTNINSSTNIKRNSSFSFGWAYDGACGQMVAFYLYQNNVLVSQDSDEEAYDIAHRDEICEKRDGMTLSHPAGTGYELRAYYDYDDKDDTIDGSVLGVSSTFDIVDENDAPIALNNLYLFAYTNGEASSQIEAVDLNDDDLSYSVNEQPSSGSISVSASGEVTYSADSSLGDYAFSVNISDGDSTTLVHGIVTVEGSANISGWREAFDIYAFTRTNERMDYIDLDVEQGYIYAAGDDASTNGGYLKKYDTNGNFINEVAILPDSRDDLPFDSLDLLQLGVVDVAENRIVVGHSRDGIEVFDLDLQRQWAVCKDHSRLSCVNNDLSNEPIDAVIGDGYVFVAVEESRELRRYDLSDGGNSVSPFWSDNDNIDEDAEYNRLFYKANYFSNMYWGLIAGSEGSEEEVYWWNIDTRNDNLDDDYKERIDVDISALFATSDYIFAGDEDGKVTIIYYSTSQSSKCESDEFVSGSSGDDITGLWADSSTIYAVAQNGSIYFLDYNCNVNGSIATGSELTAIAVEMGEIIVSDVDGHIKKYSPNRIPIVSVVADSVTSVGQELVVLASSSDPDDDELQYSWSLLSKPIGSSVSISSATTDQISFTPDVVGEYQVKVMVSDGIASASDTLTIAVNNNNPPEDSEQKFNLPSNSVISDTILITDIDEQDSHSLSIVSAAQHGDFYLLSDNKFSYNPSSNFIGTDQVLLLATDNYGGSGTITVIFDVQNRLPYASSQNIEVISGDSFSGVLTASDDDGGDLTFSVTTLPSKGILDYDGQGNFVYTADAGLATSTDSFAFRVNDGYDWSASSAIVDITILDADLDGDGIISSADNCPSTANPEQADLDGDAVGDVCDSDIDGDNVVNDADAFPTDPSETLDSDGDGIGNNTDEDDDGDTIPDEYELANGLDPLDAADAALDNDGDGDSNLQEYINNTDPNDADDYYYLTLVLESESADVESATGVTISFEYSITSSTDTVGDYSFIETYSPANGTLSYSDNKYIVYKSDPSFIGTDAFALVISYNEKVSNEIAFSVNVYDDDPDGDGISSSMDNCPDESNPEQSDIDSDSVGDACDSDIDGDNVANDSDAFPMDSSEWLDTDADGIGNNADEDDDGDTMPDEYELANGLDPLDAADAALDNDGDGDSNLQEYINNTDPNDADDYYYLTLVLESESADVESATGVAISFEYSIASSTDTIGDYDFIENTSPANGTLSYSDNKYIVYESDPGFIGTDAFALALSYNDKLSNEIAFNVSIYAGDPDGDGIISSADNCPDIANPEQSDLDNDSIGDVCDSDIDGDGYSNADEELARSDSYDPTSVPGSIGIFAGWNLIALSLSESGLEIQDLPTEIILLSTIDSELGALGWSRDYELPSAEQLTILRIGQAYWLKSSADFVWNYPTTTDADTEELGLSEGANYIGGQQGQVQQVLASIAEAMFIAWGYKSGEWFAYSSSGDVNENLMRRGILQLTDIDRQDGLVVMLGSASDLDALLAESIWPELSYKVGSAPTIDALNCTANYDERMGYVQLVANDYDGDLEQVYWYSDGLESAFEATVPSVNEYVFDYTASEGDKFSPVVMVSDAQGNSSSASCVIDLSPEQNYAAHQPTANITVNPESIVVGDEVTLDGSGSSDPNDDDLTYAWSQPVGQGAHLSSVTMPSAKFTADAEGTYSFTLTVDDGEFNDIATINLLVKPIITPTDFAAEGGEGQVTLTWTPHSIATAHNIYRSDNPDCDLSNINHCSSITGQSTVISSVSSPFVDTGLINNTTYYYWIEATLDGDVQLADDYVSATPQHATATNSIPGTLNDTGIDWYGDYLAGNKSNCSSDPSAPQDCHQGRDATNDDDSDGHAGFSFTKLDRNGNILGASATAWSCVRDNVTGLVWEVKTDDGGIHDKDNTYRWGGISAIGYDSDSREGEYYDDWDALVNGANNNKLCGYEDWRVPNINELAGIADLSRYDPAIDTNYFPNTKSSTYWSASPKASNYDEACEVYFNSGSDSCSYSDRDEESYVRLVRPHQ